MIHKRYTWQIISSHNSLRYDIQVEFANCIVTCYRTIRPLLVGSRQVLSQYYDFFCIVVSTDHRNTFNNSTLHSYPSLFDRALEYGTLRTIVMLSIDRSYWFMRVVRKKMFYFPILERGLILIKGDIVTIFKCPD